MLYIFRNIDDAQLGNNKELQINLTLKLIDFLNRLIHGLDDDLTKVQMTTLIIEVEDVIKVLTNI